MTGKELLIVYSDRIFFFGVSPSNKSSG